MNVSPQFIRIGLQKGIFPFGYAVKMSGRWTYFISKQKFVEHTGIKVKGGDPKHVNEVIPTSAENT